MTRYNRLATDDPFVIGLATIVVATLSVTVATRTAVLLAGLLSGPGTPGAMWQDTVAAVANSPAVLLAGHRGSTGDRPPGAVVWAVAALLALSALAAVLVAVRTTVHRAPRPGLARPREVDRALGSRVRRRSAGVVRPSLAGQRQPAAREIGVALGLDPRSGHMLAAAHEDSLVVVGPPRMGKTRYLAARWVLDAPGPVLATSTKADLLRLTAGERDDALAWDPEGVAGWPFRLRWSPVSGCADPATAIRRADALVAARPLGEQSDAAFFAGAAGTVLRCLLHAAALDGRTMAAVASWSADLTDDTPKEILRTHPGAHPRWADELVAYTTGSPETVASIRMTLGLAMQALADPAVSDACCPADGDGLDVDAFVGGSGPSTLYVLSRHQARSTAPLATALVDEVVAAAGRVSQRRPAGRLDPPLRLVLDEAANVCPLPGLPDLLSDAGGRGVTACVFLQSLAQARTRWGRDGAGALWAAGTAKVVLGGLTDPQDLEDLSRLCGDRQVPHHTRSVGPDGRVTRSVTSRRERVLPPSEIRQMGTGRALLLYRTMRPALVRLRPVDERRPRPATDSQVAAGQAAWTGSTAGTDATAMTVRPGGRP
jgi:type IV secretion system protein VirD4